MTSVYTRWDVHHRTYQNPNFKDLVALESMAMRRNYRLEQFRRRAAFQREMALTQEERDFQTYVRDQIFDRLNIDDATAQKLVNARRHRPRLRTPSAAAGAGFEGVTHS